MAGFRRCWEWALLPLLLLLFFEDGGECCGPLSRELHVCLNVYLERDFPLLETLVSNRRRGRVILEGPDLADICRHMSELQSCYSRLLPECDSAWKLDRFARLMAVLRDTDTHLCANGTDKIRDLLLHTDCMSRTNCSGFHWLLSWRKVLRMQVSPSDRCRVFLAYRDCLNRHSSCKVDAYISLLDVWLSSWCGFGKSSADYLYYASNASWS